MAVTGFYKDVLGTKLYLEKNDGPADGTFEILALPTAGRETRQYHRVMELLENKYQIYTMDFPGHGKSWPLKGNKVLDNYKDFGRYIWATVEAVGIKNVVIIGCSMGGNLVYHMAQDYPVKAICSMQGGDNTHCDLTVLSLLDNPAVSVQHSHMEYSECLAGYACPEEAFDFIRWGVSCEIGKCKCGDLTMYAGFNVRDRMNEITCPVLVIHGQEDPSVTEEMVKETMSHITNSKKLVYKPVPGYGHFIAVEAPEAVAKHLDDFLTELAAEQIA